MRPVRARWAVALRIGRRSALRSWGRSLLIVLLIAIPIAGLAAAALVVQSSIPTTAERLSAQLGRSQAVLEVRGYPDPDAVQDPTDMNRYSFPSQEGSDGADEQTGTYADPAALLPSGTRILTVGSTNATFRTPTGFGSLTVTTGPSWDPALQGRFALLSGRGPKAADEVSVSPAALTRLGVRLGDTVTISRPISATVRVVGIERDLQMPFDDQQVFAPQATFAGAPTTNEADETFSKVYYLPDHVVSWSELQSLNKQGVVGLSRTVALDPPPTPSVIGEQYGGSDFTAAIIVGGLGAAFAVLEIALLAGAAFAVGARQQQRMLATVASVGGDRSVLVRIITGGGVVLGAVGGLLGVALGIAAGAVYLRIVDNGNVTQYPGFHVPVVWLVLIAAFAVGVGWLAAVVPARAAAKLDVVRALRGARTPQRVGVRRPTIGLLLLIVGIAASIAGGAMLAAVEGSDTVGQSRLYQVGTLVLLGGGPILAQIGALLCTGLLLRSVTRLLTRAPLGTRLAARDTSRNLGRTVPAVASLMTTVFLAVFIMCIANANSIESIRTYGWRAQQGQIISAVSSTEKGGPSAATGTAWAAAVRKDLPVSNLALLSSSPQGVDAEKPSARKRDAIPFVAPIAGAENCSGITVDRVGAKCGRFSSSYSGTSTAVWTGSVADLAVLLGRAPSTAAQRALASGGAVSLLSDLVQDGHATLQWFTPKQVTESQGGGGIPLDQDNKPIPPVRSSRLPAVVDLPRNPLPYSLFVSPATAAALHIRTSPQQVVATLRQPATDRQLDAVNNEMSGISGLPGSYFLETENGPLDTGVIFAWSALFACLVIAVSAGATAIGLARVDGRADDATLQAVGSSPRIRRTVAFVQALIVCGLGGLIGTALALAAAAALGPASASLAFAPPWPQVVLIVVGIPLVLAAGSWLLVGNRAVIARRPAIG
ncbi:hypothetical protein [uncultured Amnibacterium sp.]|uniref:hypothetical protein n=1 Tax=uncultured Amnibacterium sp. TaxID=1631851 RepID=UPI0035C9FAD4